MRDKERLVSLVREMLIELGVDVTQGDLQETPRRVAQAFLDLTEGLATDPPELKCFPAPSNHPTVKVEGYLHSLCEHHALLMFGTFTVAYKPKDKIIGVSKIPRYIHWLAARPQLQERLTYQIAKGLYDAISPEWIVVSLSMFHSCCYARGEKTYAEMTTTVSIPEDIGGEIVGDQYMRHALCDRLPLVSKR